RGLSNSFVHGEVRTLTILLLAPALIQLAEATVAVALRMHLPVLFPSQLQRQMGMSLELFPEDGKIWQNSWAPFDRETITEKCFLDALFVPAFRQRPPEPCCCRFLQVVMDGSLTDGTSTGDSPLPQP